MNQFECLLCARARASTKRMKFSSLIPRKGSLPFKRSFTRSLHSYFINWQPETRYSRSYMYYWGKHTFLNFLFHVITSYLHFWENISRVFPVFSRNRLFLVFYCVFIIIYSAVILLYNIAINCRQVSVRFLRRCKLNFAGTRDIALKLTETCK